MALPPPSPTPVRFRVLGRQVDQVWAFYLVLLVVLALIYYTVVTNAGSRLGSVGIATFTLLMLVHTALHLNAQRFEPGMWRGVTYMAAQLLLASVMAAMAREYIVGGLFFPLAAQGFAMSHDARTGLLAGLAGILCWSASNYLVGGIEMMVAMIPVGVGMFAFVIIYVAIFMGQERERGRIEGLLRELEVAHRDLGVAHGQLQQYAARIEELTISQERQRMARELHDTLAQGLAGLIMQLEAVDGLLAKGNVPRAQTVTQQTLARARTTLAEARRSIQALRAAPLERGSLAEAIQREVDDFTRASGVPCTFSVAGSTDAAPLPQTVAQQLLRIVQEGLANVERHARAQHAKVELEQSAEQVTLAIVDDGVGFVPQERVGEAGHFGLVGLQERVRLAGGRVAIESAPGRGTALRVELPLAVPETEATA